MESLAARCSRAGLRSPTAHPRHTTIDRSFHNLTNSGLREAPTRIGAEQRPLSTAINRLIHSLSPGRTIRTV